jgi:RHS repeat-associated protein
MKLTYIKQAGEPVGDGGDQYTGLDRFGRVIDQRWPQGASELERVDYGYTRASNRQWRQELVASGQDEYYNYDGLYQVAASNRGTLNSGKTGISGTPSWTEDFNYDPIGNWNNYLTKVSGVTDLDQSRTHNTANQTTEIDGSTATVAHDPAGNMVKVPQVADWASSNELKWDAWNRLVAVKAGATTVAAYGYDGLNRRTTKTVSGTTRRYYYSDQWQVLEERVDAETAAERQFVWGLRYTDDLVLRDRDVDHDASMDERLYVLSDYFNPTAIADEDGVVLERYAYDAFGLSRVMDPDFDPRSSSDFDWETRYGAYRYDPETGFYQVRYRYLHPNLGRWLSRDPIAERGGLNLYAYVNNNSTDSVDPYGQIAPILLWLLFLSGSVRAGREIRIYKVEQSVEDLRGSTSRDIFVGKCEIVIVYGHGSNRSPLRWHIAPSRCNAAGAVTCWSDANAERIVQSNGRVPDTFWLPKPINPKAKDVDLENTNPLAVWDPQKINLVMQRNLDNAPWQYFDGTAAFNKMRNEAIQRAKANCKMRCCKTIWIRFIRRTTKPEDDETIPIQSDIPIRCR